MSELKRFQCLVLQMKKQKSKEGKEFSQGYIVFGRVGLEATSRYLLRKKFIFIGRLLGDGHSQNNYQS